MKSKSIFLRMLFFAFFSLFVISSFAKAANQKTIILPSDAGYKKGEITVEFHNRYTESQISAIVNKHGKYKVTFTSPYVFM